MSKEATSAWSRLWATGAAHSCAGSFDQVYGGTLGAFWQQIFSDLPRSARVLDIACGNGALARLLSTVCQEPDLRCDAVDAADLNATWAQADRRLHFHPRTMAESLPFGDASFDLVVSQYGIEYADVHRALREAIRVLKADGRACFVVHHQDGRPCELAREELRHVAWLTRADGWFDAARAMLEPMGLLSIDGGRERLQTDPRFTLIRKAFDAQVAQAGERARASHCGDLLEDVRGWTSMAFRVAGTQGVEAARPALDQVRQRVDDTEIRLRDLLAHAPDEAALARMSELASACGFSCEATALHEQGQLMGMAMILTRDAARPH